MAYKTSYELHHHFPRLAEESGFTFNTHRPRVHIDWNKIKLIDLDSLIRERKFVLIEQHLNDILDCVFESEFDVRILDEGVMKMFRLAQLAVEYQQFCRHYLDRSVYVLREEINSLAQELDTTKKQLQDKEEELRKLKRRSRHSYKTDQPNGNDNIAAMILKTLSNKSDVLYPTNAGLLQHNQCNYCEKVFLNQLYLQSHIARRHAEVMETPQKDNKVNEPTAENAKLSEEIKYLKTKLKEMEEIVTKNTNSVNKPNTIEIVNEGISESVNTENTKDAEVSTNNEVYLLKMFDRRKKHEIGTQHTNSVNKPNTNEIVKEGISKSVNTKNTKDVEASTNNEDYLLNKFDEWKKAESEKYNNEINMLKNHILETFNSIKEKQITQTEEKEPTVIEQLQNTIVQQGAEIMALKHKLTNSKLLREKENTERKKESEAQIAFWSKRADAQSKQYDALLQKLSDVARDAAESRALAKAAREKASQLQVLLQQSLNRNATTIATSTEDLNEVGSHPQRLNPKKEPVNEKKKPYGKRKQNASQQTLENLHKKAQELLNVASVSSSSESSNFVDEIQIPKQIQNIKVSVLKSNTKKQNILQNHVNNIDKKTIYKIENNTHSTNKVVKDKKEKSRTLSNHVKDTVQSVSGSPVRVVRAKITEEVNNRIVSFGVDPLKSRLPQNIYQKQRMVLQQLYELKSKKNPSYEKTKYNILAKLDSNTEINKTMEAINEYVSPKKVNKPFRSISSVISNVKSKALSLVKLNENIKDKRKTINGVIAKRATQLLSTPPDSVTESPFKIKNPKNEDFNKSFKNNADNKTERKYQLQKEKVTKQNQASEGEDDSEDTTESEHKQYNRNSLHDSENTKSIDNLIKSPARRPSSADKSINRKYKLGNGDLFTRTQSALNLTEATVELVNPHKIKVPDNENSSDDIKSLSESPIKNSDENIQNTKQTKGVLKNAASISSLNKKKVLFDMDAIQMKSVSASPSQSITEKSDGNEKYELGLVNLDGEEWDISSIENDPLKNDTKIQVNTRASPKIAELKQAIESQLARRNDTPSTAIVGGVDILSGPLVKPASFGGSNTSVGSSILDESDGIPVVNHKAFVKSKKMPEKEDSEIDISEFSIDGTLHRNESF